MEPYLYARETEKIISHALNALGLDYPYLKARLDLPHRGVEHLKSRHLSATRWLRVCDVLCLPIAAASYGYNHREHKARIRARWEWGVLDLPMTSQLKGLIREIKRDIRAERRYSRSCYSRGLRFRIFYRTLRPNFSKFLIRTYNHALIRVQGSTGFLALKSFRGATDPL
jgi:hypothetical protein